jgi:hypothetical protein
LLLNVLLAQLGLATTTFDFITMVLFFFFLKLKGES